MRLPPWFSNLLPEGPLREWIGLQRRVPVQREMELLVEVGHDLPGAVRLLPIDEPLPPLTDAANGLDSAEVAPSQRRTWRFSLSGVALKFSLLRRGDRFTAPASGWGGDWIVKLPDPLYPDVPRNELCMMELARRCGMNVPETMLVERELVDDVPNAAWGREEQAYAIRRFDRDAERRLVHIEDLAQVRGWYPERKYDGTFETVPALLYRGYDTGALQEFARRLAFNVFIGNGDAHLKNWSLIYYDPRRPTLAPAYDVVATFVYRPTESPVEDLGLRFGGSRHFAEVTPASFEALDTRLAARAHLAAIAVDTARRAAESWPSVEHLLAPNDGLRAAIGERIEAETRRFLGG